GCRGYVYAMVGGESLPLPVLVAQVAEKRHSRGAYVLEFFRQIRQAHAGMRPLAHKVVLLKAGQGRAVTACNAQRAVGHDPLGVDHVAKSLFQTPLAWCIAQLTLLLAERGKQRDRLRSLARERSNNIVAEDE